MSIPADRVDPEVIRIALENIQRIICRVLGIPFPGDEQRDYELNPVAALERINKPAHDAVVGHFRAAQEVIAAELLKLEEVTEKGDDVPDVIASRTWQENTAAANLRIEEMLSQLESRSRGPRP